MGNLSGVRFLAGRLPSGQEPFNHQRFGNVAGSVINAPGQNDQPMMSVNCCAISSSASATGVVFARAAESPDWIANDICG